MKYIAIYARQSKHRNNSVSIETQISICTEFANKRFPGKNIKYYIDYNITGRTKKRDNFNNMINDIKYGIISAVIVYQIDRINRRIYDYYDLRQIFDKKSIEFISAVDGMSSLDEQFRLYEHLKIMMAQEESINTSVRVINAMNEANKSGRTSGGSAPTGYIHCEKYINNKLIKTYDKDESNIKLIEEIFNLACRGYSAYRISTLLHIPHKTVYSIIKNPTYTTADDKAKKYLEENGYIVYNTSGTYGYLPFNRQCKSDIRVTKPKPQVSVGYHEPLVTSHTWIKANEAIKSINKKPSPNVSKNSLLAQKVVCSCGKVMCVEKSYKRKTNKFRCRNISCPITSIKTEFLEKNLLDFMRSFSNHHPSLDKYCKSKNLLMSKANQISSIEKEIANLDKKIQNTLKSISNANEYSSIHLTNLLNEYSSSYFQKSDELNSLKNNTTESQSLTVTDAYKKIQDTLENIYINDIDDLHVLINNIVKQVVLCDDNTLEFHLY